MPKIRFAQFFLFAFSLLLATSLVASQTLESPVAVSLPNDHTNDVGIPRVVRFAGSLSNAAGTPQSVAVTFAFYKDQSGGAPLWVETQVVNLDEQGHYTALLGAGKSEGLPADLFTTNEARWLSVTPQSQSEQSRVLLVSVPYALKAADAETLGGHPASDFMVANGTGDTSTGDGGRPHRSLRTSTASSTKGVQTGSAGVQTSVAGTGTTNKITKWTDGAGTLGDSAIFESGGLVGINTTTPADQFYIVVPLAKATAGSQYPFGMRTNDANANNPFGYEVVITGAAALANRSVSFQTSDLNLANAGNLLLQNYGGLVGVGTSNPTDTLSVGIAQAKAVGALATAVAIRTNDLPASNPFGLEFSLSGGSTVASRTAYLQTGDLNSTNGGSLALQPFGGLVGIGTPTPSAQLAIVGPGLKATVASQFPFNIRTGDANSSNPFGIEMEIRGGSTIGSRFVGLQTSDLNLANGGAIVFQRFGGNVGIGTGSPAQMLSVAGTIESTSGGFKFPDGTTQATVATGTISGVTTGVNSGLQGGGTSGTLNMGLANCPSGQILKSSGTSTWGCAADATGGTSGGTASFSGTVNGGGSTTSNTAVVYSANATSGLTSQPDPVNNIPPSAIAGEATNSSGTGMAIGVSAVSRVTDGIALFAMATGAGDTNMRATALNASTTSTSSRTKAIEAGISGPGTVLSLTGPSGSTFIEANIGTAFSGGGGTTPSVFHVDTSNAFLDVPNISFAGSPTGNAGGCCGSTNLSIQGNVSVQGTLSVSGTKNFKIDDPLDPANKYLYHTSVESPDMMNIYNGVARLNAQGESWIVLPEYFQALNRNFRYQLTAMGKAQPGLFVAREVRRNRFKIAGGEPGAKVSWQVTGVRQDAWAKAHPAVTEVDKGTERGRYLNPELFGQPGQPAIGTVHNAPTSGNGSTTGQK